jgi:hypothetical protein
MGLGVTQGGGGFLASLRDCRLLRAGPSPARVCREDAHPDFKKTVKPLAERYDPNVSHGPSRKVGYRVNRGRDVLAYELSAL